MRNLSWASLRSACLGVLIYVRTGSALGNLSGPVYEICAWGQAKAKVGARFRIDVFPDPAEALPARPGLGHWFRSGPRCRHTPAGCIPPRRNAAIPASCPTVSRPESMSPSRVFPALAYQTLAFTSRSCTRYTSMTWLSRKYQSRVFPRRCRAAFLARLQAGSLRQHRTRDGSLDLFGSGHQAGGTAAWYQGGTASEN
jgi:hypothetical protein